MEEKKESNLVKSVADFIDKITKIGKIHKSVFFRGHSDESFELVPSIYRKNDKDDDFLFIENEDKIYREIIAKSPAEFNGKKTIEALALMQHYGVPTRVLDLTTNALIALYFACNEKPGIKGKNGEVLVFDIPKEYVCFSDSDRVAALSNLAKCDNSFYYKTELLPIYEKELKLLENKKKDIRIIDKVSYESLKSYLDELNDVLKYVQKREKDIEKYLSSNKKYDFEDSLDSYLQEFVYNYKQDENEFYEDEIKNEVIDTLIKKIENSSIPYSISRTNERYFGKLLHNIREDKSYFQPIINPNDIGSVFAVIPKMDNPRIVRQSGAFLLFGIKESPSLEIPENKQIKSMADVPKEWIVRGNKDKGKRILIDKSSKNQILKELDMLGINKSSIFPEIESIAESVKNKYKK